jgi:hypothetical protein
VTPTHPDDSDESLDTIDPSGEDPIEDPPSAEMGLLESVIVQRPEFADGLAGDVNIRTLSQPFFTLHRIFWIDAGPVQLHVAEGEEGDVTVLTGDQAAFNELSKLDPPGLLLDEATAHAYAVHADTWIADWPAGERYLQSFDAIEMRSPLSAREQQTVDAIRERLGADIVAPRTVKLNDAEFALDRWVVADRKLVRRRLMVTSQGRVACDRQIKAAALPIR